MNDVKIAGSGVLIGGEYNNISTAGSVKITGDIKVKKVSTAGSAKFLGKVDADEISIAGSVSFEDDINANKTSIAGSAKVLKNINSKIIKVSGKINVVELSGSEVVIKSNRSKITKVIGDKIFIGINRRKKFFKNEIDTIEGKNIEINHTNVKFVKGESVNIGINSSVERIEYSNTLTVDKKANVKEKSKILF